MPTFAQAAIAAVTTSLEAMSGVLAKAEAYCAAKKIKEDVLLQSRLYPDMFPLVRQIQIASDHARNGLGRIAGAEPLAMADTDTSFAELRQRLEQSVAYIRALAPESLEAGLARAVQFPLGPARGEMQGDAHLGHFLIPNIYFHLTTAYGILRKAGVEIGKRDFMGNIPLKRL